MNLSEQMLKFYNDKIMSIENYNSNVFCDEEGVLIFIDVFSPTIAGRITQFGDEAVDAEVMDAVTEEQLYWRNFYEPEDVDFEGFLTDWINFLQKKGLK